jgi:hypothetical protein
MSNLVKSYVFWTYNRGTFHYDVMVTLILLFMFVTPRFVDFKDRPVETVALHSSEVLVKEAGMSGSSPRFLYTVRADNMGSAARDGSTDSARRTALLRVIEPISGEVSLERYEEVKDAGGHVVAFNVWVTR